MRLTIKIPVDVYLVTLLVDAQDYPRDLGRPRPGPPLSDPPDDRTGPFPFRRIPPGRDPKGVPAILAAINNVWQQADIQFVKRNVNEVSSQLPVTDDSGQELRTWPHAIDTDRVNGGGFKYLARKYPAQQGASLFFVADYKHESAQASTAEVLSATIVSKFDDYFTGKVLAHEFGHLLGLPDLRDDNQNLMYWETFAGKRTNLTAEQVAQARQSRLVSDLYHIVVDCPF
jgi:hypothetical protein